MRDSPRGLPNLSVGVSFGTVDEDRRAPLHRKLGIQTYTHMQAILCDPNGMAGARKVQTSAHWYRMPVTLPKVF